MGGKGLIMGYCIGLCNVSETKQASRVIHYLYTQSIPVVLV